MDYLIGLACGEGHVPNWEAISAVATTAAVMVALWIPIRDRRLRAREQRNLEARAAEVVNQSLQSVIEVLPSIVEHIQKANGALLDVPGAHVLYGVEQCREIIEKEPYCNQLPNICMGLGIFVASLARKWCDDINTRMLIQRNEALMARIDWRNHDWTRNLGIQLHVHAVLLRQQCEEVIADAHNRSLPLHRRLWGHMAAKFKRAEAQQAVPADGPASRARAAALDQT